LQAQNTSAGYISELIASSSLQSKESMLEVMKSVDQANGYLFGDLDDDKGNFSQLMSSAVGTDFEFFRLVYEFIIRNSR